MSLSAAEIARFREAQKAAAAAAPEQPAPGAVAEKEQEEPGYGEVVGQGLKHGVYQGWAGTLDALESMTKPGSGPAMAIARRVLPNSVVNRYLDPMRFFVPMEVLDEQYSDKRRQAAEEAAPKPKSTGNAVKDMLGSAGSSVGDGALMPGAGTGKLAQLSSIVAKEGAKSAAKGIAGAFGRDVSVSATAGAFGEGGKMLGEGLAGEFTEDEATKKRVGALFALPAGLLGGVAGATRPGAIWEGGKAAGKMVGKASSYTWNVGKSAIKAASAVSNKEETRTLRQIFSDEMGSLLKVEQGVVTKSMQDFMRAVVERDPGLAREMNKSIDSLRKSGMSEEDILQIVSPATLSGNKALALAEKAGVEHAVSAKRVPDVLAKEAQREQALAGAADKATEGVLAANPAMLSAYKRVTGASPDMKEAGYSVRGFRNMGVAARDAARARARATLDALPRLDSVEESNLGQTVMDAQRAVRGRAPDAPHLPPGMWEQKEALYNKVKEIGRGEQADTSLLAQIIEADSKLIGKGTTVGATPLQVRELVDRPVTMESVVLARQDVNKEIRRLSSVPGANADVQYLSRYKDTLDSILNKGSTELRDALSKADTFYGEKYAPLFREGLPGQMMKQATLLAPGETRLVSSNTMSAFTKNADTMNEFVRLASGQLSGKPRPDMYQALGRYLEGDLAKKIRNGDIKPENFDRWVEANQHALKVVPETAMKLEKQVSTIISENARAAKHEARMKAVLGGPVSSSIGPAQAKTVWTDALTEGNNMEFLIAGAKNAAKKAGRDEKAVVGGMLKEAMALGNPYTDGVYDAAKAGAFLESSSRGLRILFKHALGSDKAAGEHLDTLKQIAKLQQRAAELSIKHAPIDLGGFKDPLQASIGTSIQGVTGLGKSMAEGRVSAGAWAPVYLGVRLVGAKVKAAHNKAWEAQTLNPREANNYLKTLLKMENGQMPSGKEVDAAFGPGVDAAITDAARRARGAAENILVPDEIRLHLLRGMLIGEGQAYKDE